jgi:beta-fructofuranosidase
VLNDFAVLEGDDGWHLLHLQAAPVSPFDAAAQETSYGHAHSTDLVRWEPCAAVFGIAPPGRFDDSAIWTMSTIDHPEGGLYMFYTGVCNRPHPATQAIGLAWSPRRDGTGWRRARPEPVCTADPRWYRTDAHQAWRDPFVVRDDESGEWVLFVAARESGLPPALGGCIATAVSTDLTSWAVLPPRCEVVRTPSSSARSWSGSRTVG